jgi:hypothetical protein
MKKLTYRELAEYITQRAKDKGIKPLTLQELNKRLEQRRKVVRTNDFHYMRLLREDYPNVPINEYTKALIDKIKKGT